MNVDEYRKRRKEKNSVIPSENKFLRNLVIKILVSLILFLCFLIGIKKVEGFDKIIYDNIYNKHLSFASFNSWYNEHFGSILPLDNINKDVMVFSDSLTYKNKEKYLDGVKLEVENNYLVPILKDGIVVYIGEKDNYGKVIIVEDEDGLDTWYSNINIGNINIYDYVKKGDYLGEVIDNSLILVFEKKGKIEDYNQYI